MSRVSPMMSNGNDRAVVVVARHGERQDYEMLARGENWLKTAKRPWDPALSELGWRQGTALGEYIRDCVDDLDLPPVHRVYSSPFQRCRETAVAANEAFDTTRGVKVEFGLAESLNEQWYRSWSLPTSNGTWGYKEKDEAGEVLTVNLDTLHPAALHPATSIIAPPSKDRLAGIDREYKSRTRIHKVCCWGSFESAHDQRKRMRSIVNTVARPGSTVVLVSHGGPVTHLFEELTGKNWWVHGEAQYAACSVYEKIPGAKWDTLVMNENKHVPNC